jgi:cyclopropane fatty-acyl-phospholipid synthase-like methyltransferase
LDIGYWNEYYEKDTNTHLPSTFAQFCMDEYLAQGIFMVELGSGNCRDAEYFSHKGISVYAIDQSHSAILIEKKRINLSLTKNLTLIETDFTNDPFDFVDSVDVFYSRFTIHSITEQQQDSLLFNVFNKLKSNGMFFIEVRTINDPMFGKGKDMGKNAFFIDHYRRFIDVEEFCEICKNIGFEVAYLIEKSGLSIVGNDDPVLMRIALRKK